MTDADLPDDWVKELDLIRETRRPWQEKVFKLTQEPIRRGHPRLNFILRTDDDSGLGKTLFTRWMEKDHDATQINYFNLSVLRGISAETKKPKVVLYDPPKAASFTRRHACHAMSRLYPILL